jgi:glycerol-3-phosphate acyltransferase PlsY
MIRNIGLIIASYLIGSILFAYIIAQLTKGIDIREHGDGNPGGTNAIRVLGLSWGIIILLLDILKGVGAMAIADALNAHRIVPLCGFLAVVGHNWSVFLKFRGGKGIATSIGVLFYALPGRIFHFLPYELAVGAGIWAVFALLAVKVDFIGRCHALGWSFIFIFLPFIAWGFGESLPLIALTIALALMALVKQIPNIKRLFFLPAEAESPGQFV